MTARIIDGKAIAQEVRAEWKLRADALKARGITPGLAVIIVGEDPASKVYVANKVKACAELGCIPSMSPCPPTPARPPCWQRSPN